MYALQPEPEERRRWPVLVASGSISSLLFGVLALTSLSLQAYHPPLSPQRVQMQIVSLAPPAPVLRSARPEPPPEREAPKPTSRQLSPKPKSRIEPHSPPPSSTPPPAAEVAPSQPPPLVLGLTLSSTSRGARGPHFAVGNSLLGTPSSQAQEPRDALAPRSAGAPKSPDTEFPANGSPQDKEPVAARLLSSPSPYYPPLAKLDGVEGVVVLTITIDAKGRVESARVLRPLGYGLDESALQAARETQWAPATFGGQPIRTTRRFNVRFTLQS